MSAVPAADKLPAQTDLAQALEVLRTLGVTAHDVYCYALALDAVQWTADFNTDCMEPGEEASTVLATLDTWHHMRLDDGETPEVDRATEFAKAYGL